MFTSCGILFNHESPRRPLHYLTRKVAHGVARIKLGLQHDLHLGNLDVRRDWGFAGDYVRAMWAMLQQDRPDDYVVASGVSHSVRELVDLAFSHVGLRWEEYTKIDPACFRPLDSHHIVGDAAKAETVLGWKPQVDFPMLIRGMVEHEMQRLGAESGDSLVGLFR
jgi:GDPmannose 4,6-dehydratase